MKTYKLRLLVVTKSIKKVIGFLRVLVLKWPKIFRKNLVLEMSGEMVIVILLEILILIIANTVVMAMMMRKLYRNLRMDAPLHLYVDHFR